MATYTDTIRPKPVARNTFETLSWLFMRVSGVALLFLALGHLLVQHITSSVYVLSVDWVALRWANLGWRVYDAFLLGLALIHGLNGLRFVVDDYVLNPGLNRLFKYLIVIAGAALIVVGSITIIGGVRG
jgi:succinate dehydrogenase / fumarate reductase membrane anchor subunit